MKKIAWEKHKHPYTTKRVHGNSDALPCISNPLPPGTHISGWFKKSQIDLEVISEAPDGSVTAKALPGQKLPSGISLNDEVCITREFIYSRHEQ